MTEPTYIAQTAEREHLGEPVVWLRACLADARAAGSVKFSRSTMAHGMLLLECWPERPEDQGEPRWQVEAPRG